MVKFDVGGKKQVFMWKYKVNYLFGEFVDFFMFGL